MSLTSLLKDSWELKDYLKTKFPTPKLNLQSELKVHPLTNNYGGVGTAFDYLFRAKMKYDNKYSKFEEIGLIATQGFKRLQIRLSNKETPSNTLSIIEKRYKRAEKDFNDYHRTGEFTDAVIESALFMAKLDLYVRAKYIDPNYESVNALDIVDIRGMLNIVDKNQFQIRERCWLNPAFGGSPLVNGADADIIIDDTLIDLKTSKYLKLDRDYINQIICYYVLSLMGGVNGKAKDMPIKKVGIYFARYGELWVTPLSQLGTDEAFHELKNWLHSYCREDGMSYDEFKLMEAIIFATQKKMSKTKTK